MQPPYTPQFLLMSAVRLGDIADVRTALKDGAGANRRYRGCLPLCLAVARGFVDIFQLLIQHGASPRGLFKKGDVGVPLTIVLDDGKYAMFKAILSTGTLKDKISIDWKQYKGHVQTLREDSEIVAMLEKLGAPLPKPAKSDSGEALLTAANDGKIDAVRKILKRNPAVVHFQGQYGTALHAAAASGHAEVVEALLKAGAKVDAVDDDNLIPTPLWWAAEYGHDDCIKLLLDHGAKIDYTAHEDIGSSFGGCTPLHVSLFFRHAKVALLLIQRGADIQRPGREKLSVLEMATNHNLPKVCEELRRRGMK